ncbi:hypothetical protein EZL74_04235 [Flavobacterium silvisoli]|uniref:DUF4595 domain-containing protein n=1 Tax=Flavobacterium silvisoli TaxID=2529433 RepID=A0A4V2L5E8_9FLAO|nr:hypothetical protein [Flavobacterium silvisoli]TBX70391.1 hypothetical protein EZL74_04235 [Flavobacterium silvisoli]
MKKILVLTVLSTLLFTSCSSSDSSPAAENDVLMTKSIATYDNGTPITTTYVYSGKKIQKSMSSNGYYEKFYYTGDLLTRIDYFDDSDVWIYKETYDYNSNNQLISYGWIELTNDYGSRELYTHNSDGTISVTKLYGNASVQSNFSDSGTIYLNNGDVSMIDMDSGGMYMYSYDSKNSPFKNITGLDKVNFTDGDPTGVFHNMLTESHDGFPSETMSYNYTYNGQNFPSTREWNEGSHSISVQYFYN